MNNKKLISAIERTIQLLESSEDSDWSSLSVNQVGKILENELVKINESLTFDKLELAVLFAPSSNVQEIALRNDWHKEYLELSKTIDEYTG